MSERVPHNLDERYNIAKSQNNPVNITQFVQKHAGDPAVEVSSLNPDAALLTDIISCMQGFVRKLKVHLLPRILDKLSKERSSGDNEVLVDEGRAPATSASLDHNSIFFKSDRMYQHQLLRINYTTYDVRRDQDVINPRTSRCDIMLLANNDNADSDTGHPFWYARVLGIYHVNVVYTGSGMID
jgi:hypothetical protein